MASAVLSGRCASGLRFLFLLLSALLLTLTARGEPQPAALPAPSPHAEQERATPVAPPPPGERDIVIVPYDPKFPPQDQQPDQLYLPYERFLQLWNSAKDRKRVTTPEAARGFLTPDGKPMPAPLDFGLTSARYTARLEERGLVCTGQLELFTGKPWVKVPLPFARAKVSSLTVDAVAAVWRDGALLVEKAGRHQIEIAFELPRAADATDFRWGLPRSTATLLTLTLPQAEMTATIEPGSGAVERLEGGARIVTAALGAAEEVRVHLRTAEKAAAAGGLVSATLRETAKLSALWEEFQGDAEFTFPSSVQDHFTLFIEKGLALTDLSAPNLKSWTLRPDGERQALDLTLYEPAKDSLSVHLAAQRLPAAGATAPREVPLFSTNAGRTEVTALAVLAAERTTATLTPGGGLRQISWDEELPEGWRLAGAFAGSGALQYQLATSPPRREAKVEYLYQVGRRQLELFASMELLAQGDPLESVRLELPPGFEVETLQSARPHAWWPAPGGLIISFQDATPASTLLVLHLVQRAPPAAAALEMRSIRLLDFHKVTSEVSVAAHKGVEAVLTLPALAGDLPPAEAAQSFGVVAPLERKRGFRMAQGDFAAQVRLVPITPRSEAVWALRAEAHEAWLGLSYAVRLNVRQGSFERARFTLPAALPEARVSGSEVREARSRVEGDLRIYDVDFQNEIFSSVEFAIDLELPHTGAASLPALLFPDTQRASGFLMLENGSEGEMRLDSAGLEKAAVAELPWTVPHATRAQLYRVPATGWSAKITVERLEKATGRLAFCPWAELSTSFRRDGTAWHKAVWHLQNRALQFLPVRLPAGAELVSVRVAGQSVRADRGADNLLIPLIKTKPGELSYDVEAIYRTAHPALAGSTRRTLEDPDLVGITVERTFWNVWAPAGFEIEPASGGNMEQIIQEVAAADKLDSAVEELKGLNSIINLGTGGALTQQLARGNFDLLQNSIQQDERAQMESNNATVFNATANGVFNGTVNLKNNRIKGVDGQNSYVQGKLQAVNEELRKQTEQLKEIKQAAPVTAAPTMAGPIPPGREGAYRYQPHGLAVPTPVTGGFDDAKGWKLNPANQAATSQTATPKLDAGASQQQQLALNDNVNYNLTIPSKPAAGPASGETTNYVNNGLLFENGQGQVGNKSLSAARALNNGIALMNESAPAPPAAPMPEGTEQITSEIQGVAGLTKAGRGTLNLSGGTLQLEKKNSYTGQTNTFAGTLSLGTGSGSILVSPDTLADLPGAAPKLGKDGPAPVLAAKIPVDRRITLAIDFPTEGEPIHFKKLKGAAQVRVELEPQETTSRGRNFMLIVLAAVLLVWARRRMSRRPTAKFAL